MAAHRPRSGDALITGLTGQDGSFLAELLLEAGYEVTGLVRTEPGEALGCAEHLRDRVRLIRGELLDRASLVEAVGSVRPRELYHLASPSFLPDSWRWPGATMAEVATATAALPEAVRERSPHTRVFVASSGTMFGAASQSPQNEDTACRPLNPYATAKLAAHQLVGQLRAHDELFACSGILYNHESERRSQSFVSRKVTRAAAEAKLGMSERLELGDLDAVRDWSFAGDTMRGAWLMLQQEQPSDYILASGVGHTVRDLVQVAFAHVGLAAEDYVHVDPALVRGREPTPLVGDATRAREQLSWAPTHSFEQLIRRMVDADMSALRAER